MEEKCVYEMNALNLAFMGDAVFTVRIREELLKSSKAGLKEINRRCNKIVCARSQAKVFENIETKLFERELDITKRARNAHYNNIAKHSTLEEYSKATEFEALLGYLHLSGQVERLEEVMQFALEEVL